MYAAMHLLKTPDSISAPKYITRWKTLDGRSLSLMHHIFRHDLSLKPYVVTDVPEAV
jgi:hypothetical protein